MEAINIDSWEETITIRNKIHWTINVTAEEYRKIVWNTTTMRKWADRREHVRITPNEIKQLKSKITNKGPYKCLMTKTGTYTDLPSTTITNISEWWIQIAYTWKTNIWDKYDLTFSFGNINYRVRWEVVGSKGNKHWLKFIDIDTDLTVGHFHKKLVTLIKSSLT